MLDELIYNLCDNAIRYNNPGGSVVVRLKKDKEETMLSVKDTGIGIPIQHQERVFERFYRVDKSRSKSTGRDGAGACHRQTHRGTASCKDAAGE